LEIIGKLAAVLGVEPAEFLKLPQKKRAVGVKARSALSDAENE